ncbi:MAG: hypothetical protein ACXWYD_15770 [Candidatus Binatia bacterium]
MANPKANAATLTAELLCRMNSRSGSELFIDGQIYLDDNPERPSQLPGNQGQQI